MLAGAFAQGQFLTDAQRQPIANDFVAVYAAGQMALAGHAAAAYDWPLHKTAEVGAVGHDFPAITAGIIRRRFCSSPRLVALLPYLAAALIWLIGTLAAFAATLRFIVCDRAGIFVALGFPAAIWNVTAGLRLSHRDSDRRHAGGAGAPPCASPASLLGLLTYKPQFGLLFPLALIADRRWLTIAVAAAVASAMAAASWLAFGSASWQAFLHWLPITGHLSSRRRRRRFRSAAEPLWFGARA